MLVRIICRLKRNVCLCAAALSIDGDEVVVGNQHLVVCYQNDVYGSYKVVSPTRLYRVRLTSTVSMGPPGVAGKVLPRRRCKEKATRMQDSLCFYFHHP